jgi:hypothetical protein
MLQAPRIDIVTQGEANDHFHDQTVVLPPKDGPLNLLVVYDLPHIPNPDPRPEAAAAASAEDRDKNGSSKSLGDQGSSRTDNMPGGAASHHEAQKTGTPNRDNWRTD